MRWVVFNCTLVLSWLVWGCELDQEMTEFEEAEQSLESVGLASAESEFAAVATLDYEHGMTAQQWVELVWTNARHRFRPRECVSAEVSPNQVVLTLDGCTGMFGHREISGTVVATLTEQSDDQLAFELTGVVTGRRFHLELDGQATLTRQGTERLLQVNTNSKGRGPRGGELHRVGDYRVGVDTEAKCVSIDGEWTTRTEFRARSKTVSGFTKCKDQCPLAGGVIELKGSAGRQLTIEFDGTDHATWTAASGKTGTIELDCP